MRLTFLFLAIVLELTARARAADIVTLAGSGAAGYADGPAAAASFLMPEGIALAPNGDLYVADTGAQRIRKVSPSGTVSTVAGAGTLDASRLYVAGGYADGPALQARFDRPTAVAVASNGGIVVADRGNHCLRFISGGVVSTYAGRCGTAGTSDGAKADALFTAPMALAFDSHGTLYVADFGTGIRKVATDGTVQTMASIFGKHAPDVTGLSTFEDANASLLYAAAHDGVFTIDLRTGSVSRYYRYGISETYDGENQFIAGSRMFGYPYAIAAVANGIFVYTDIVTNAVRFLIGDMTDEAIGAPVENARQMAGAFRDGGAADARVDEPMGIVRLPNGDFAIADTGNRRIRAIHNVALRHASELADLGRERNFYRIVYIGNSFVTFDQRWDESVAGILERNLLKNWKQLGFPKPPRVYAMQVLADLGPTRDYINTYLAPGLADMVILQLNSGQVWGMVGRACPVNLVPYAAQWQPLVTSDLKSIGTELGRNRIPFVVAINPFPFEVSPVEASDDALYGACKASAFEPPGAYAPLGFMVHQAVAGSGVDFVDAFPAFRDEELLAAHPALFSTRDFHWSTQGAALNAQTILDYLLRAKPWTKI